MDIKLFVAPDVGNWTGIADHNNGERWVKARISQWATPEQNQQLEQDLCIAMEKYLKAVSEQNNGRY